MNLTANVLVFIGLTKREYLDKNLGKYEVFYSWYKGEDTYDKERYHGADVFIHPDLQTSEVRVDTVCC